MVWRKGEAGYLEMSENATFSFPHTVTPVSYMPLPSCLPLGLYSPSPPFFCPRAYYNFSCTLSPSPLPFTPFSLTPLLCPPFFSLPQLKMHTLLSALAILSGQRGQNNGCLSVSQPGVKGWGGGYWLLVFFFLYCHFKQANAASLSSAGPAPTPDWAEWHCMPNSWFGSDKKLPQQGDYKCSIKKRGQEHYLLVPIQANRWKKKRSTGSVHQSEEN